jgi:putative ABC transport system substrate-binding protein
VKPSRRSFVVGIAISSTLVSIRALGQQSKALPRVALVSVAVPIADMVGADPVNPSARALVHALRDLGLVDGRNIVIERRSAEGRPERLAPLMQELVAGNVDVIVTSGTGVSAATGATKRIPIVAVLYSARSDGLVSSLARPGGNLTGVGRLDERGLTGKWLQLLKEAAPRTSRVAVIANTPPPGPTRASWRDDIDATARSMQLALMWPAVDTADQYDPAFATILRERANALILLGTNLNNYHARRVADWAVKHKLPSFSDSLDFAESGGLLSYGGDYAADYRRIAAQVKKILDGAKPGDLPFEQSAKTELVINLKTANALGLAIPQALLARADKVIRDE